MEILIGVFIVSLYIYFAEKTKEGAISRVTERKEERELEIKTNIEQINLWQEKENEIKEECKLEIEELDEVEKLDQEIEKNLGIKLGTPVATANFLGNRLNIHPKDVDYLRSQTRR